MKIYVEISHVDFQNITAVPFEQQSFSYEAVEMAVLESSPWQNLNPARILI